ncbi:MAG TPA: NADPH:quinone oxidoreductase family protein [Alphaproteobacteria bacterium]|jgi:NADPH2:quinone reductase|nr:NADPH:quinone oxidoreductase family protein [Alphaproteobacteria bacterium]
MRAVLCRSRGGPDDLTIEDVPPPTPGPGQVVIGVRAAGLNFADTLIIAGKYQERPAYPFSPGMEVSGDILACGSGVTTLARGDRVMAIVGHGGFAEQALAPAERVLKIPASMDYAVAAGFPVAYGTSHVGLVHRAALKAGETLLVHGAAGGVGLTAVEIGKVLGATVIATASSADKLAVARSYGADHLIDYSREDVRERVLAATGGRGADVVYDPVGGDAFDASLRCTAFEGRIIVIGFASGKIPQIPANHLLVKNISAVGFYWGAYNRERPSVIRDSFVALLDWFVAGKLRPLVSQRFALEEAPAALKLLAARKATGKVVLTVGG